MVDRVKEIAEPILRQKNAELVDINYIRGGHRLTLQLFVDKPGGITLEECAKINQELSDIFDEKDLISDRYVLEVSSPGLDRELKGKKDYLRETGKLAKIIYQGQNGKSVTSIGKLIGVEDDNVVLQDEDGKAQKIAIDNIIKAKLEVVF